MPRNPRHIVVAAAVIHRGGRILSVQRSYGSLKGGWEFPGGKLEPGETAQQACIREIREELGCTVAIERFLKTVTYAYDDFDLTMHCFLCHEVAGEQVHLLEHSAGCWLARDQVEDVAWLPADVAFIHELERDWPL
jgi:8-oxo-dGTP diphosphatase